MNILRVSLIVVAAMAAPPRGAVAQPKVEPTIVGRAAPRTEAYTVSPRGVHYAVLTPKGSRSVLVVDGVEGPEFDAFLSRRGRPGTVANDGLVFSADGARYAYFAAVGSQYVLVVDGKEMARGELGPSNLGYSDMTFSPGGEHVYFVDLKLDGDGVRARAQLVMDGKAGPPSGHQNIFPVFSPDETHWAYNAIKFGGRPDENISVVDGKEVPFGFNPVYTGDNKLLSSLQNRATDPAVVAINGKPAVNGVSIGGKIGPASSGSRWAGVRPPKKPGEPSILYIDGREVPEAQNVEEVIFSADSKRYMALCRNNANRTRFVVIDGRKGPEYQAILANSARFSADSSRAIYVGNNLGKNFVVVDGQPSPGYLVLVGQQPIVLSQKGGHYGYVSSDGVAQTLTIDGNAVPSPGSIVGESLGFSPDGARYAYAASRGGRGVRPGLALVVDGQEMSQITLNETVIPNSLPVREWWFRTAGIQSKYYAFSPDGKHIAFCGARADDPRNTLFVDGKALLPSTGLRSISLVNWTPDGKHLYWVSLEKGSDRPQPYARVVLDGTPTSVKFSDGEMTPYPGPWRLARTAHCRFFYSTAPTPSATASLRQAARASKPRLRLRNEGPALNA